ncbi:Uncharacterised protein [Vibrio cholerae]|nr:Uncharacterised protein [Vibrio cholerae]
MLNARALVVWQTALGAANRQYTAVMARLNVMNTAY